MNGHYTYNFLASKKKINTEKDKIRTMTMINVVSTGHRRHMHDINIIKKTYGDTLCDFVVKNYYTILKNLKS